MNEARAKEILEAVTKWKDDRILQINSDKGNLLLNDVLAARMKDCLQDISFLLTAVGELAALLTNH